MAKTLRLSVYELLRGLISDWQLTDYFRVNKSDMEIEFRPNGNRMSFVGLDDVEKLKSIVGITSIWVEEATELDPGDLRQLDLRLRGFTKDYKQIVITFNPVESWLKDALCEKPRDDTAVLMTTYKDNRFIDPEYKQVLESLADKDEYSYKVYALGLWAALGNLIWTNWEVKDIPTDESHYGSVYRGMDFGFNDPSALIKIGYKDDELYVFSELYERGLTNTQLIDRVAAMVNKRDQITADSSEPARIQEFINAGFRSVIGAKKEKDSVTASIDWIKRRKIWIHPDCVHFIREIKGYKYRELKDGTVLDEPVDLNNHLADAARYAIEPLRLEIPAKPIVLPNFGRRTSPNII